MRTSAKSADIMRRGLTLLLALLLALQLTPAMAFAQTTETMEETTATASDMNPDTASEEDAIAEQGEIEAGVGEGATVPHQEEDPAVTNSTETIPAIPSAEPESEAAVVSVQSNEINISLLADGQVDVQGVDWTYNHAEAVLTLSRSTSYIIGGSAPLRIVVAKEAAASLTLNNVCIDLSSSQGSPLDITGASLSLLIQGTNILRAGSSDAAITVLPGSAISVEGEGILEASGGKSGGAGIGGSAGMAAGSIALVSGAVLAVGGYGAAGIGGGNNGGSASFVQLPASGAVAIAGEGAACVGAGAPSGTANEGIKQLSYSDGNYKISVSYQSESVNLAYPTWLQQFQSGFSTDVSLLWVDASGEFAYAPGVSYTPSSLPAVDTLRLGQASHIRSAAVAETSKSPVASSASVDEDKNQSVSLLDTRDVPVLAGVASNRVRPDQASVIFTTTVGGSYYYEIVDAGAPEPVIDTSGAGTMCTEGMHNISLFDLRDGPKDIYLIVKTGNGDLSNILKMSIGEYLVLTAGASERLSDSEATVSFVSNREGQYYYGVVDADAPAPVIDTSARGGYCAQGVKTTVSLTGLAAGEKDVYILVRDVTGVVSSGTFTIKLESFVPVPVVSEGSAVRIDSSHAVIQFTSTVSGSYYYDFVGRGSAAPEINTDVNGTSLQAGVNTLDLQGLSDEAYDLYLVAKNTKGKVSAETFCIPILPVKPTAASTATSAGSFYLAAALGSSLIVDPTVVSYGAGDTIATALTKAGLPIVGAEENTVISIAGKNASFTASPSVPGAQTGDVVQLNTNPEVLKDRLLFFTNASETLTIPSGMVVLSEQMVRYNNSPYAQQYGIATAAYNSAVYRFVSLFSDAWLLNSIINNLRTAIDGANQQFDNADTSVSFTVSNGDTSLTKEDYEIRITTAYDITFTANDDTVLLPQGKYTYEVSYGAQAKRAKGSLQTTGTSQEIVISFPEEAHWITGYSVVHGSSSTSTQTKLYEGSGEYAVTSQLIDTKYVLNTTNNLRITATKSDALIALTGDNKMITFSGFAPDGTYGTTELTSGSVYTSTYTYYKIDAGSASAVFNLIVEYSDVNTGIDYSQIYTHTIERLRSLDEITFKAGSDTIYAASAPTEGSTVSVPASATSVTLAAQATDSYNKGNTVYVDGNPVGADGTVSINFEDDVRTVAVEVRNRDGSPGIQYEYVLKRAVSQPTVFTVDNTATLTVFKDSGEVVSPVRIDAQTPDKRIITYDLNKGEQYSYSAVKNTYFKVSASFTAGDEKSAIEPEFDEGDYVQSLKLTSSLGTVLEASSPDLTRTNTVMVKDTAVATTNSNGVVVTLKSGTPSSKKIYTRYAHYNTGTALEYEATSGTNRTLANFMATNSGVGNRLVIALCDTNAQGESVEQTYIVNVQRALTLSSTASNYPVLVYEGNTLTSELQPDGTYLFLVPSTATEVTAKVRPTYANTTAQFNGIMGSNAGETSALMYWKVADVPLTGTDADEEISIELAAPDGRGTATLVVKKTEPAITTFSYQPAEAQLTVYSAANQAVAPRSDGSYSLLNGASYSYSLVAVGYIAQTGSFVASPNNRELDLGTLVKAEDNESIDPNIDADWGMFRGEDNNGVINTQTPTSAEDTVINWSYAAGSMSNVGQSIYANGHVISFASVSGKNKVVMLDPVSGELVAEGMLLAQGGLIPTYADGMIFAPLAGGRVQAFNANPRPQTAEEIAANTYTEGVMVLDSLWQYKDATSGGGVNPIYYSDGHIYVGWQTGNSGFVCLTVTDEDPNDGYEFKTARWRWVRDAMFYWAGAIENNGFVLVGGDASATGVACLRAATGELLDTTPIDGNVRASITYDTDTDRYYTISQNGKFYSMGVDEYGKFYDVKALAMGSTLSNGIEGTGASTSTPAIFNGRAYVGICGSSQFTSWSGHHIAVIDLERFSVAYRAETQGYCQSSGLITTAYMDKEIFNSETGRYETGFVYVYFTQNISPGPVAYLVDKPGVTEAISTGDEPFPGAAPVLITPRGAHGQYSLLSITIDEFGMMMMKTDTGKLIAFGPKIEDLEIVAQPTKTVYFEGETFDPTGIKVVAHYTNGATRDITKYLRYAGGDDILTYGDNAVLAIFPYSLYSDSTPDQEVDTPTEELYTELGFEMPKIARPSVSVLINVLNSEMEVSVREVEKAIDNIGEVSLDQTSKNRIDTARLMYDSLDPQPQEAVSNLDILVAAENRYQYLQVLKTGSVPIGDAMAEGDEVDVRTSGPVVLTSDADALLSNIAITLDEALALEKDGKVTFYVESKRIEKLSNLDQTYLDPVLTTHKLIETGVVYEVKIFKQIGDGDKVQVLSLLGSRAVETLDSSLMAMSATVLSANPRALGFALEIPADQRIEGRVFRMVSIKSMATEVHTNKQTSNALFYLDTTQFSTFVLTYVDTSTNENTDPGDTGGNVTVGNGGNTSTGNYYSGSGVGGNVSLADADGSEAELTTVTAMSDTTARSSDASGSNNSQSSSRSTIAGNETPLANYLDEMESFGLAPFVAMTVIALVAAALGAGVMALVLRRKLIPVEGSRSDEEAE